MKLLLCPNAKICEQAILTLGNIIGDGPELREKVIKIGVVQLLVSFVKPLTSFELLRNVVWLIRNLCQNEEPLLPSQAVDDILPTLIRLIRHSDVSVLIDTLYAISNLADGGYARIDSVIDSGIIPHVIPLLSHADDAVKKAALSAIGNITTGSDDQIHSVLYRNVLDFVPALLNHPANDIRKETVWLLSNITDGDQTQIQAVIDAGILPKIVEILWNDGISIKKEAIDVICNAANGGSAQQARQIIRAGVLLPMHQILQSNISHEIKTVIFFVTMKKLSYFIDIFPFLADY